MSIRSCWWLILGFWLLIQSKWIFGQVKKGTVAFELNRIKHAVQRLETTPRYLPPNPPMKVTGYCSGVFLEDCEDGDPHHLNAVEVRVKRPFYYPEKSEEILERCLWALKDYYDYKWNQSEWDQLNLEDYRFGDDFQIQPAVSKKSLLMKSDPSIRSRTYIFNQCVQLHLQFTILGDFPFPDEVCIPFQVSFNEQGHMSIKESFDEDQVVFRREISEKHNKLHPHSDLLRAMHSHPNTGDAFLQTGEDPL